MFFFFKYIFELFAKPKFKKKKCIISLGSLFCCCSVTQLYPTLWPHGLQNVRPSCPSPSPEVFPSSCPLHWWCHPAISSSGALFSFCPQSFPASGTFPMNQLLADLLISIIPLLIIFIFQVKKLRTGEANQLSQVCYRPYLSNRNSKKGCIISLGGLLSLSSSQLFNLENGYD